MKNEKQHSNKNDSTVKKTWLTAAQKRDRAILVALPRNSKLKELLLDKKITFEELERDIPAIIVGASFDRKHAANMFSLAISMESYFREVKKISREQYRRYKIRKSYSANLRRYFEDRIIFGWSKKRETFAIATEIVNILKSINSDQVRRLEYLAGGLELGKIIRSIGDRKLEHEIICQKIMQKLEDEDNQEIMIRFKGIIWKSERSVENVNKLANTISKGYKRPYLWEV